MIFYTHNGCITDKWWPALEDGPLKADTFSETTLEVLAPYYKKLLMPRGFRSMNMYAEGQTIDPHDQAMGSKLTCATINEDSSRYATAASLDHVIAQQINPAGAAPLVLSVGRASTSIKEVLSFSAPSTAFPANVSPLSVYNALTGKLADGAPGPEATFRRARGESVIDLVRDDLTRLKAVPMSGSDQQKIEDWLDLLRETEVGVSPACSTARAAELGITLESVKAASPPSGSPGLDPGSADSNAANLATSFTLGGDMMMNLMALSMLCDTNRSLLLTYPGYVVFNWDGIAHTHDHAGLSNRTGDFSIGGACNIPDVIEQLLQIDRWYAGKYARLVGLLDRIGEGDGSLLDNTATVWLPELSDGSAHNLNNLPIMIAGGAGGYLKQGYAVNVEGAPIGLGTSSSTCQDGVLRMGGSTGGDVPINKLYVTLMNALGCTADGTGEGDKVTRFGQFDGFTTDSGITNPGEVAALTAAG